MMVSAQAEELRLLTWGGYAPQEVIDLFEKETGIDVKVTVSNNEDMISKLRATRGAGFDLAQPSQDRILGAQKNYRIYKPMDMSKIDTSRFIPSMLKASEASATIGDDVYAVPHIWGTSGLIVNQSTGQQEYSFNDLCSDDYAGKVSYRLKRPDPDRLCLCHGRRPFCSL